MRLRPGMALTFLAGMFVGTVLLTARSGQQDKPAAANRERPRDPLNAPAPFTTFKEGMEKESAATCTTAGA